MNPKSRGHKGEGGGGPGDIRGAAVRGGGRVVRKSPVGVLAHALASLPAPRWWFLGLGQRKDVGLLPDFAAGVTPSRFVCSCCSGLECGAEFRDRRHGFRCCYWQELVGEREHLHHIVQH